MPNEKNSAISAICAATSAARGSSIIVPIWWGTGAPFTIDSGSATTSAISAATACSSCTVPTSGTMISGQHGDALGGQRRRGAGDRADLHREQARARRCRAGRRAARASGSARAAGGRRRAAPRRTGRVLAALVRQRALDRQLGEVRQELVQRRVEQPDRDRQALHRAEDRGEVLDLHRQQRGQRLLPLVAGLGQHQALDELAPVAEEHVLGAAQPDALGAEPARAVAQSSPVSALTRTFRRRRESAWRMIRSTASTRSSFSVEPRRAPRTRTSPGSRRPAPRRGRPRRWCRRSRSRRPRPPRGRRRW